MSRASICLTSATASAVGVWRILTSTASGPFEVTLVQARRGRAADRRDLAERDDARAGAGRRLDRHGRDVGLVVSAVLDQRQIEPMAILDPADAATLLALPSAVATSVSVRPSACSLAGSTSTAISGGDTAKHVDPGDAGTVEKRGAAAGRRSAQARSLSSFVEVSDMPSTGKIVGSDRRTLNRVPGGRSGRIVASAPCVASVAATMSSPQAKLSAISAEPRLVVERICDHAGHLAQRDLGRAG